MIGVKFRLEGVTAKGKNRIREHGEWWEVLAVSDSVSNIKATSSYLLKAETTGYLKWGPAPDFEIREIFHSKKGHK